MRQAHIVKIRRSAYRQKFLLSKGQGYPQYAVHGRSEVVDAQAVILNHALNLLAIMLPSFRASHEGAQHADDLSQNSSQLSTLPGCTRRASPRCLPGLARGAWLSTTPYLSPAARSPSLLALGPQRC